jgi:hypothetical protein
MNKKQLIVAWGMGILISLSCIFMPNTFSLKKAIYDDKTWPSTLIGYKYGFFINNDRRELRWPVITYNRLLGRVFPILILGGLLIYTLRDKKK